MVMDEAAAASHAAYRKVCIDVLLHSYFEYKLKTISSPFLYQSKSLLEF